MATRSRSEDELDSFNYACESERYKGGDIEDEFDEDEDGVIDSGDPYDDYGNRWDFDLHGDDDWNFEGGDKGNECDDDGGESEGDGSDVNSDEKRCGLWR